MVAVSFFPLPFLTGLTVLALALVMMRIQRTSLRYRVVFSLFWLYLLMVSALTIFPLYLPLDGESRRSTGEILSRVNLIPFHLMAGGRLRREMIANILMTIPFGLLLPAVARVQFPLFLLAAVGIGAGIEMMQFGLNLFTGYAFRVTDINDVIFNFTGAMIGYGLYWIGRLVGYIAQRVQPSKPS